MNDHLMTSKRFAPLFWTQFLSAFNDNFLKNTLVFLILFQLSSEEAASLVTLAGAVFMAPFLLLSALGGELADRFDKAVMAQRLKLAEVGGALVAVAGIAIHSIPVLMTALFIFGVVSALFGPIKYGILPDHLPKSELPKANAYIEGATFAAILGGTIVGGLASTGGTDVTIFGPMMLALAVGCWLISRAIPRTGSAAPDLRIDPNILRSTARLVSELRDDRRLWSTAIMAAWFWLVGAIMLSILPTLVKARLGGAEIAVTAYLAVFAVAVGIGSALAAWMSQGRIVLLPAPLGTALMALFGLDLAWTVAPLHATSEAASLTAFFAGAGTIRVAVDLAGLAIAGAFLAVPSFAALQSWAREDHRARVVAGANVISAGFMTVGGGVVAGIQAAGVSLTVILLGLAILNVAAAVAMLRYLPTSPFRDFVSIFFRAFHRLEVEGLENLKAAGPAPILALNHVSFLDGPLALTLTDEEPVFAIDHTIASAWWVKPFLKFTRALPLDPARPMATRTLIKVVQGGDPLVIFPEGRITVTGALMKVYDGAAMVADKTGAKIVPIRIDGLERSMFSRLTPLHVRKSLFPKVKVTILPARTLSVPDELKGRKRRAAAGAALYDIMSDLVFRTQDLDKTILEKTIATARMRGMGALAVEDPVAGKLSYGRLLTATAALARQFKARFSAEDTLGIMLPSANGACVTTLAALSAGKVPAMINFTSGAANIRSACRAAKVSTILTSRSFIEKARLAPLVEALGSDVRIVHLEDIRESIGLFDKMVALVRRASPLVERKADDPAVVLFTSGSEGAPKGVLLTHRNILANAAQAAARIDFHSGDKLFNVLPMFHAFGLTAGTILPLTAGVPVYFYPSPLHYRLVPELIYASNATIIFGTDTFLAGYARTAHPYDFRSIRYCFAGAEPVRASTRATFMDKFGVRVLEGYGVTEAAPVVALNTPMHARAGTVGKLMPAIEHRLEPVPGVEEGGRLHVRGPNVMAGYLRETAPGVVEEPEDGWHDTGDIVSVDADGFVTIKGRAKRFAKIAGEMVSLAAIEALAADLWPDALSVAATVADDRKGERLVLLTEAEGATRESFTSFARGRGANELMMPAELRVVEKLPVLGTGKVDYRWVAEGLRAEQMRQTA
ncbi:acyl-[ACP]--phospholipid O-acyltransferase [Consotaella salsifontis]|uniref:Acyl-[acyl-carrier-protein]-phospholipid O-acyltransferase / long-chain-fatty-acid--[acyl-carrier-protein] ligase n=1 Tax=Consotaella salsifontis TaxID=1365950 RepID=A0A1T4SHX4_9HYPH|nr:acyl-[ACP]--phospholipid O-acyltransferase [Consotaella salsifontis]SKA27756.1 acyl-[acyl-carrier-protein]-phospholipid O-acyltransferase / long-chain-fatty-acid--[acyl-carrier-protein] ligase [Consotaella salsifontis]